MKKPTKTKYKLSRFMKGFKDFIVYIDEANALTN